MPNTGKNPYGGEMGSANMEWMRRYDPRYWQQFQNLPNARQPYGAPPPAAAPAQPPPLVPKPQYTPRPGGPEQRGEGGLTRLSPGLYRDAQGNIVRDKDGRRPDMQGRAGQAAPPPPGLQQAPPRTGGPLYGPGQGGGVAPGPMPAGTGTAPPPGWDPSNMARLMEEQRRRREMMYQTAQPNTSLPNTGYDPNSVKPPFLGNTGIRDPRRQY